MLKIYIENYYPVATYISYILTMTPFKLAAILYFILNTVTLPVFSQSLSLSVSQALNQSGISESAISVYVHASPGCAARSSVNFAGLFLDNTTVEESNRAVGVARVARIVSDHADGGAAGVELLEQ